MMYDATAGIIDTPGGQAQFVQFDGRTKSVLVALGDYFVFYPAESCFIKEA